MLKNYIKIAIRNILRDKHHAAINVFGLALGMACAMLVILYVNREFSYDKAFNDSERIYRISTKFYGIGDFAGSSPIVASLLKESTWVEESTQVSPMGPSTAKYEQTKVHIKRVSMADSSFFKIFSYPFTEGDRSDALTRPGTVVISKNTSDKLFGDTSALGKILTFDNQDEQFEVTGVFDNSGILTHLESDVFISRNEVDHDNPWWNVGPMTYTKVKPNISKIEVEKYLKDVVKQVVFPATGNAEATDNKFEEWYTFDTGYKFYAFPLEDIYFDAKLKFEPFVGGEFQNIVIFSVIGLLVVVIATFNFINLSTAKAIRRATEVGIRKTLGSGRLQLMGQFMLESMVISLLATTMALGLTELLIILSNYFVGAELPFGVFTSANGIILLVIFALLVGVLSAIYPAFYLTRFSPSRVIKAQYSTGRPGFFRSVLVIVQFTISIALIIGSLVIYQQIEYIRNKDMGFDQSNSIVIKNLNAISSLEELKNEMSTISGVIAASIADRTPGDQNDNIFSITENGKQLNFEAITSDANLIPILDIMVIKGRNFDQHRRADTASVILNQKAVELLGYADPVGQIFDEHYEVIGVVSDFHFKSMKREIEPLLIFNKRKEQHLMLVKIHERESLDQVLEKMKALWHKHNNEAEFDYSFLDENYAKLIEKDEKLAKAISLFTGVAVLISLMGLLGLCSYTMERKTKEIGIRKVLGASWQNIVSLFSMHFVKFVIIAFLISIPIAWYIADLWLNNFAYHTKPEIWIFLAGGIAVVIPTWIMVALQAVNAAKANPVDSLRDE